MAQTRALWPVFLASLVLALTSCDGADDDDTKQPEATTPATEREARTGPAAAPPAGSGGQIYVSSGCGSCHGMNAEGTDTAPPLAGHTHEQIVEQVRAPMGAMPAYSTSQISDAELEQLAEYIGSLEERERHVEPLKLSNLVAAHHRMALSAIRAEDVQDAIHHVNHVVERVRGEHLRAMREARELLESGDHHDAEHLIEEMLAGRAEKDLRLDRLYLQLALTAAKADDRKEALHDMRHFRELVKGARRAKADEVIDAIRAANRHATIDGIRDLLGLPHE